MLLLVLSQSKRKQKKKEKKLKNEPGIGDASSFELYPGSLHDLQKTMPCTPTVNLRRAPGGGRGIPLAESKTMEIESTRNLSNNILLNPQFNSKLTNNEKGSWSVREGS